MQHIQNYYLKRPTVIRLQTPIPNKHTSTNMLKPAKTWHSPPFKPVKSSPPNTLIIKLLSVQYIVKLLYNQQNTYTLPTKNQITNEIIKSYHENKKHHYEHNHHPYPSKPIRLNTFKNWWNNYKIKVQKIIPFESRDYWKAERLTVVDDANLLRWQRGVEATKNSDGGGEMMTKVLMVTIDADAPTMREDDDDAGWRWRCVCVFPNRCLIEEDECFSFYIWYVWILGREEERMWAFPQKDMRCLLCVKCSREEEGDRRCISVFSSACVCGYIDLCGSSLCVCFSPHFLDLVCIVF